MRSRKFGGVSQHDCHGERMKFWFRLSCATEIDYIKWIKVLRVQMGLLSRASPSIIVDRLPPRTMAPHGITGPELDRLNGAVQFMRLYRWPKRGLWWLTTNKGTARPTISNIQKRITRLQIEHGLRCYRV